MLSACASLVRISEFERCPGSTLCCGACLCWSLMVQRRAGFDLAVYGRCTSPSGTHCSYWLTINSRARFTMVRPERATVLPEKPVDSACRIDGPQDPTLSGQTSLFNRDVVRWGN